LRMQSHSNSNGKSQTCALTFGFCMCMLEYLSLSWFSLIPLSEITQQYFNSTPTWVPQQQARLWPDITNTGFFIVLAYAGLLLLVFLNYNWVFLVELGVACCCSQRRATKCAKGCFWKCMGKAPFLTYFLLPLQAAIVCGLIAWDYKDLSHEAPVIFNTSNPNFPNGNNSENKIIEREQEGFLTDIAMMLGDVLLLKHLITKIKSLATHDLTLSAFIETHSHLHSSSHADHSHHRDGDGDGDRVPILCDNPSYYGTTAPAANTPEPRMSTEDTPWLNATPGQGQGQGRGGTLDGTPSKVSVANSINGDFDLEQGFLDEHSATKA